MDKALQAVQRLYRRIIQPVFIDRPDLVAEKPDLVGQFVREAYRIGAEVGWKMTSGDIERNVRMPQQILDDLLERARRQGEDIANRLGERSATTPITGPQIAHQTRVAGESSAWSGMDTAADQAAKVYTLRLKTWIRAYSRKEPRPGHTQMEGTTIPIDELFVMPSGARVYAPRDWDRLPDPAEWVNCGHALRYSSKEVSG